MLASCPDEKGSEALAWLLYSFKGVKLYGVGAGGERWRRAENAPDASIQSVLALSSSAQTR